MAGRAERVQLPGSEREFQAQHERIADADADKQIEVTVYLRARGTLDWVDDEARRLPTDRRSITHEDLARGYAAREDDVEAVRSFARDSGLEVAAVDPARRTVTLRGSVEAIARAFGARDLGVYEHPTAGAYRARRGPLTVPGYLSGVVTGVFGIDERPQARPQLRRQRPQAAQATSYKPQEVAQAYNFPTGVDGSGETVGIIELGGGFSEVDLNTYFNGSPPSVIAVGVDGAVNSPGTDPSADGEVMLDLEVVGAVAPGAKIVVYFAPNTDQGFIDAVSTAVHDTTHNVSVVSISWGGPEDSWTAQARNQMEQVMIEAAALGVTVTVAAGDDGSTDGVNDGRQHVDFPASAPHALACGGTTLQIQNGKIASETVWNDLATGHGATGGGVSVEFTPAPSYQAALNPINVDTARPGRGVPDLSGNADPQTGYQVLVDGQPQVIGGTSAVAPLSAGLAALMNQALGRPVGFLQPLIYTIATNPGFNDITQGNNPAYAAGPGWDACSGLGSPSGADLLQALAGQTSAFAGLPGRPDEDF
jgi:kumamolisin